MVPSRVTVAVSADIRSVDVRICVWVTRRVSVKAPATRVMVLISDCVVVMNWVRIVESPARVTVSVESSVSVTKIVSEPAEDPIIAVNVSVTVTDKTSVVVSGSCGETTVVVTS